MSRSSAAAPSFFVIDHALQLARGLVVHGGEVGDPIAAHAKPGKVRKSFSFLALGALFIGRREPNPAHWMPIPPLPDGKAA